MTLPKSIFDQVREMEKLKESFLGNSYLKTLEQHKNQELLYLQRLQVTEIDKIKESLFANSASKILEQFKNQELQHQKLLKDSFAIPDGALQAIKALNARNNVHTDTLRSLFRPPKLANSIFNSTTSKLFKELSRSPLREFNKLTYSGNTLDLMLGEKIEDFGKRYKDSLKLFPSEISSALAISKMLGSAGINTQYEEILKELQRAESEESVDVGFKFNLNDILLFLLALLISEYSSSQMEQRLNNKIDAKVHEVVVQSSKEHNQLKNQIEQIELLIVNLSQTQQKPFAGAEYVVKDRSALIRDEPKNGSKVIAHIFPNQIVTIIDSEGKWIEVTYYDWPKRNYMNGWVLKKYLLKIQSE